MNKPVDFTTAKLLKEKGFDEPVINVYSAVFDKLTNITTKIKVNNSLQTAAPTIAEVVMWLYEKHGIWISAIPYNDEELSQTLWENKTIHISDDYNDFSDYTFYHSPTEAYEAAIEYTLNNLIS